MLQELSNNVRGSKELRPRNKIIPADADWTSICR